MRFEGASKFAEKLVFLNNLEIFSLEMDKVDIDNNGKMGSNLIFEKIKHLTKLEKFHLSFQEFFHIIFFSIKQPFFKKK